MGLREDIIFDKNGFVPPANIDQTESDNGILYTSQYYILLSREVRSQNGLALDFLNRLSPCISLGGLQRRPGALDQEGPDDYVGFASATRALGTAHKFVYDYGRKNWWIYNTANPGKFTFAAWFRRQPGLIGYFKYCAGKRMNPIEWLFLNVGVIITMMGKKEDTSDKMLALTMMTQLKDSVWFKPLLKFFTYRVNKVYGGVNGLVRVYFGDRHPFSKYWVSV